MLAVLNTIVLGRFARQGETTVAHARRDFASHLDKALVRLVADQKPTLGSGSLSISAFGPKRL